MKVFNANIDVRVCGIVAIILLGSCAPQKFTGTSGSANPKPAQKKVDQIQATPNCTEARLLSIRNLVTFVDQKKADRSVDIELAFETCKKQTEDINLPLLFDLDGTLKFVTIGNTIPYTIRFAGTDAKLDGQGEMRYVTGSDLFGQTGAKWGHFESSQDLNASPLMVTATMKLMLSNVLFTGRPNSPGPMTTNFAVPMNVKIGKSAPILVDIMLTPP